MQHGKIVKFISWLILLTLLSPFSITSHAQDDDDELAEIEAEINALARAVHIQDARDNNYTQWLGGIMGLGDGLGIERQPGYQFDTLSFDNLDDDGASITLTDLERPVLINFWASWCGPCIYEFPMFTRFAFEEEHNIDVMFVNVADSRKNARLFLETQPSGIEPYIDTDDAFAQDLGIKGYPTTILLDTDLTLLIARTGSITPTFLRFADLVAVNPTLGEFDRRDVTNAEIVATLAEVDPDEALPIELEEQVSGEITDEDWQINYRFEGKAGDRIIIAMLSTDPSVHPYFDPYLVLIGPDGERIRENDDGPRGNGAYLEEILPTDGTYIIVATRLLEADGLDGGPYDLILVPAPQSKD